MNPDMERFLNLKAYPQRLRTEQAAWLLGFSVTEIYILVAKKLLKPLGDQVPNAVEYFLTAAWKNYAATPSGIIKRRKR